ncbi:unnamed protein product [Victoria cruziana]
MSHDLEGHLDGTIPAPPNVVLQRTAGEDGKLAEILVRNPEFVTWKKRDQSLVAYITSTLSKDVLYTISDNMCAKELWNMLANNYSQVSEARIVQLRHQFHNFRRGSKKIMDYLAEVKTVCDSLAVVESPISDREQVQHILCTLGPEYDVLCTALQVQPYLPSLQDLKAKLLQYETQHVKAIGDATQNVLFSNHSTVGNQMTLPGIGRETDKGKEAKVKGET